jgi:hypothetical protein
VWKSQSTIGDVNFPAEVIFETTIATTIGMKNLPTVIKELIENIRSIWKHTNVERKTAWKLCPYIRYVVTYKISTAINPKIQAMFSTVLTDLDNLYGKKERYLNRWTQPAVTISL